MASLTRYLHTIAHLKPVQVYGRIWFRIARPKVDRRAAPGLRGVVGLWQAPIARHAHMALPGSATFLNVQRDISSPAIWNDPAADKLWLYNLHYFEDLGSAPSPQVRRLQHEFILRWIAENPAPLGNGWEPYPTSLRISNWIKWALVGEGLGDEARQSLAVQARWLSRRCEHHLLANHLFVNAKALTMAGMFFGGDESDAWLRHGMGILRRELAGQILADGGHFELSPMYHALILEDILDLVNIACAFPGRLESELEVLLRSKASAMLSWMAQMTHPDGEISYFNDASQGIAPRAAQLTEYAQRLGICAGSQPTCGIRHLRASGYVRAEMGPAVLLADCAAIGPDHQPGHAHADSLSFELSIDGQRAIVNTGTSTYSAGSTRSHERSTAAHNTLEIDAADSSEVWGGFRVARRARVSDIALSESAETLSISARHDGYTRLARGLTHSRSWTMRPGELAIVDQAGDPTRRRIARFHLHPSVRRDGECTFRMPSGRSLFFEVRGGRIEVEAGKWAREFGRLEDNLCVAITMTQSEMTTLVRWK